MRKIIRAWVKNEQGATAIEYGLMVAGIAVVIVGSVFAFGEGFNEMLATFTSYFDR